MGASFVVAEHEGAFTWCVVDAWGLRGMSDMLPRPVPDG